MFFLIHVLLRRLYFLLLNIQKLEIISELRLEQVEPDPNTEYARVQRKPSSSSPNPESKDEENDEDLTYKKLGRKFQILTEKVIYFYTNCIII